MSESRLHTRMGGVGAATGQAPFVEVAEGSTASQLGLIMLGHCGCEDGDRTTEPVVEVKLDMGLMLHGRQLEKAEEGKGPPKPKEIEKLMSAAAKGVAESLDKMRGALGKKQRIFNQFN